METFKESFNSSKKSNSEEQTIKQMRNLLKKLSNENKKLRHIDENITSEIAKDIRGIGYLLEMIEDML